MSDSHEPEVVAAPKHARGIPFSPKIGEVARRYYESALKVSANGGAIRIACENLAELQPIANAVRNHGKRDDRIVHTSTSGRQMTIWVDSEGTR